MALDIYLAVERVANSNQKIFAGAIGNFKASIIRVAVNLLNGTDNRDFNNVSYHPFLSYRTKFTDCVLPIRAKEEDSSSNVVPGTVTFRNLYFEQENGIVNVHLFPYTKLKFGDRPQIYTAIRHLYCNNRRDFASTVYSCHDTLQLYLNKVQTFIAKAQIFGDKVQNDDATLKNVGNRSYPLCSKRRPFAFCNQTVCTITYSFSCSFKPSMYNSKFKNYAKEN